MVPSVKRTFTRTGHFEFVEWLGADIDAGDKGALQLASMLSRLSGLTRLGLSGECGSPLQQVLGLHVYWVAVNQGSADVSEVLVSHAVRLVCACGCAHR